VTNLSLLLTIQEVKILSWNGGMYEDNYSH